MDWYCSIIVPIEEMNEVNRTARYSFLLIADVCIVCNVNQWKWDSRARFHLVALLAVMCLVFVSIPFFNAKKFFSALRAKKIYKWVVTTLQEIHLIVNYCNSWWAFVLYLTYVNCLYEHDISHHFLCHL